MLLRNEGSKVARSHKGLCGQMRGETGRYDGDNLKNVRSVVRGDTSDKMEIYDNGAASVGEIER